VIHEFNDNGIFITELPLRVSDLFLTVTPRGYNKEQNNHKHQNPYPIDIGFGTRGFDEINDMIMKRVGLLDLVMGHVVLLGFAVNPGVNLGTQPMGT
jgi:hypothetical protein